MFDIDGILKALQNDPNARRQATTGAMAGVAGLAAGMLMGKSGGKLTERYELLVVQIAGVELANAIDHLVDKR